MKCISLLIAALMLSLLPASASALDAAGQNGIQGVVTDPSANPVFEALVQVCAANGAACAWLGPTDALGNYSATGVAAGDYIVRAFPPAGSTFIPAQRYVTMSEGTNVTGANIRFGAAPPYGPAGISPSKPGGGGVPVISWRDTTTFEFTGTNCPADTTFITAAYSIAGAGGGSMTERPTGSDHYVATVPPLYPYYGNAVIMLAVTCWGDHIWIADGIFPIYIDPGGVVKTTFGTPVNNATVTLLRSDDTGASGSFAPVPDGSALLSPSNRRNPDATNAFGQFGWDVLTGFYVVRAEKEGCTAPGGSGSFVDSPVLSIPPAIDFDLTLQCPPLTALGDATVWVGLKNSDDTGTTFDMKAEVYRDRALVGSGQVGGISGGSGFNKAKLASIPLTLSAPVDASPGTVLSITLSARITCWGKTHASGTARLYFADGQAKSRFDATIDGDTRDYYLRNGLVLDHSPGWGPKSIDVLANSKAPCPDRPFIPFGTWSMTLP